MTSAPITLGTLTAWGKVAAVRFSEGERYYMLIDEHGTVSLMPSDVVEKMCKKVVKTY